MSGATLRLEDSLDALPLTIDGGYLVESYDLGDAATREVVSDRPGADGTIDSTIFLGARNVALTVNILPDASMSMEAKLDRLRAFTDPRRRPYLYIQEGTQAERRLLLRRAGTVAPVDRDSYRNVVMQWRAPLGVLEAATETVANAYASASGAELGRTYPLTYPRTYPASPVLGAVTVNNAGNIDAWPLIRIYGNCTEPNIENQTTGRKLELNSLTINAGEFLDIDTRNKTIRLNALATSSRYDHVDFDTSSPGLDLRIVPVINRFRFYPATAGATSVAQITWRATWL